MLAEFPRSDALDPILDWIGGLHGSKLYSRDHMATGHEVDAPFPALAGQEFLFDSKLFAADQAYLHSFDALAPKGRSELIASPTEFRQVVVEPQPP